MADVLPVPDRPPGRDSSVRRWLKSLMTRLWPSSASYSDADALPLRTREEEEEIAKRRFLLLGRLRDLIYSPLEVTSGYEGLLLRRIEAVEVLGRFPDAQAADLLGHLLLAGEERFPGTAGRRLRDTALLTLLGPNRLPRRAVDEVLLRNYCFWRQLFSWQWRRAYDELPLLNSYGRLGIFLRAFWSWPLLLLAPAMLVLAWQLIAQASLDPDPPLWMALLYVFIAIGASLEIYLCHQILLFWLARRGEPLLSTPGPLSFVRKFGLWLVFFLAASLLLLVMLALLSGDVMVGGSPAVLVLQLSAVLLPLLLPPMWMLAHDLRLASRRLHSPGYRRLRVGSVLTNLLTHGVYQVLLLALVGGLWSLVLPPQVEAWITAAYLAYIFLVPFLWAWILRSISKALDPGPPRSHARDGLPEVIIHEG